jgi:inner membrane protein
MASAITHFTVAAGLALAFTESPRLRAVLPRWAIPVTAGLFGAVPDLDTWIMLALEIPRGSVFSHRGVFHSPCFLTLLALAIATTAARQRGSIFPLVATFWACAAITHPLLDMLTDGGSGVMLLFPFSTERLFFPWRPIRVSPLSIARFFDRAGEILRSELPFCAAAIALGLSARAITARASAPPHSRA